MINTLNPIVRYLEGIESINNLLYDIVNTDAPLRAYFGFDCTFNNDLKFFWHTFFDSKVFDLVNVKLILPKSNKIRSFFKQFLNNNFNSLEISYMNIEDFSDNLIFLCSSKVILLNFKSKNEYSVVIESEDIYNFYKTFFDQAWDIFNKK